MNTKLRTALSALIECLAKAAGPDRDLDGRIYCAARGLNFKSVGRDGSIHFEPDERGTHTMVTPHPYTASIETALELVPEMHDIEIYLSKPLVGRCFAYVSRMDGELDGQAELAAGINPAIAVCIAALRAKDSSSGTE